MKKQHRQRRIAKNQEGITDKGATYTKTECGHRVGQQYGGMNLFILSHRIQINTHVNPMQLEYTHPYTFTYYNLICCNSFHILRQSVTNYRNQYQYRY